MQIDNCKKLPIISGIFCTLFRLENTCNFFQNMVKYYSNQNNDNTNTKEKIMTNPNARILIADENPMQRQSLKEGLKNAGYRNIDECWR